MVTGWPLEPIIVFGNLRLPFGGCIIHLPPEASGSLIVGTPKFSEPYYKNITTQGGDVVTIDVTNSISAGLSANKGLEREVIPWLAEVGASRVLDFGAGALRHTEPLLEAGFEVVAVEFEEAYSRPKASNKRSSISSHPNLTKLCWPKDFIKSRLKYDVALLLYVIQVVPAKSHRKAIIKEIAKRFDPNGPKRLYYASRAGNKPSMKPEKKIVSSIGNDGWALGVGENDRTFYTEWTAAETNKMFESAGYKRAGSVKNLDQGFIYDYQPGGVT